MFFDWALYIFSYILDIKYHSRVSLSSIYIYGIYILYILYIMKNRTRTLTHWPHGREEVDENLYIYLEAIVEFRLHSRIWTFWNGNSSIRQHPSGSFSKQTINIYRLVLQLTNFCWPFSLWLTSSLTNIISWFIFLLVSIRRCQCAYVYIK